MACAKTFVVQYNRAWVCALVPPSRLGWQKQSMSALILLACLMPPMETQFSVSHSAFSFYFRISKGPEKYLQGRTEDGLLLLFLGKNEDIKLRDLRSRSRETRV